MGHHSAGFTLDHYGHLIDGGLGTPLYLTEQLPTMSPVLRAYGASRDPV